jgi:hypothetical protein
MPTQLPKYVIEFHENSFSNESLASYDSDSPFLAFHVGDYIAPQTCGEGILAAGQCYRVAGIQHIITKEADGSHKLCVCVKSVPWPEVF